MNSFGVDTDKYLLKLENLQKKVLQPYIQVHYLITLNLNDNDKIVDIIDFLRKMEGVDVDATIN